MRKNFLLVLLLTLLPLAGWAANPTARTGLEYNTLAQALTEIVGSHTYSYYYYAVVLQGENKPGRAEATTTVPTATNAGNYIVYWAGTDTYLGDDLGGNTNRTTKQNLWNSATQVPVIISKASITPTLSPTAALFNGENNDFPGITVGGSTVFNDLPDDFGGKWVVAWTDPNSAAATYYRNAGTYNVSVSNTNQEGTASFIVGKGTNYFTADPTITAEWFYGETGAEATGAVAKWGTVIYEYSADAGTSWSDDYAATVGDAGNYLARARVAADGDNYDEITKEVSFKIKPAEVTLTITGVDDTYTYDPALTITPGFSCTDTNYDGVPTYSYKKGGTAMAFDGSVGSWEVIASAVATSNYAAATGSKTFTVTAKNLTESMLTTFNTPQDYDGTQILTGYKVQDGTTDLVNHTDFEYTIKNENGDAVTSVKNAGTYTYTFTGKGNYGSSFEKQLVVNKIDWPAANITDPVLATGLAYDGTVHNLVTAPAEAVGVIAADVAAATDFVYYLDGTETDYAVLQATDANLDGYTVSYSIKETTNYNAVAKKDLSPVVIAKAKLHLGTKTLDKKIADVYDFATETYSLTAADFIEIDDAEFKGADLADKDNILNALVQTNLNIANLKVGGNNVELSSILGTTENYEAVLLSDPVTATLNIEATPVTIDTNPAGPTPALVFNGEDQKLIGTEAVASKGTVVYSLTGADATDFTDDVTTDATTIVGHNADTYTVYYKVVLSDAAASEERFYEYTAGVQTLDVAIGKANLADVADADITIDPEYLTYDGEAKTLSQISITPTSPLTVNDYTVTLPNPFTAAGNAYKITLDADADAVKDQSNYYGKKELPFEIKAATDNKITSLTIADKDNWTYGDEATAHAASASATYGTPTITYYEADGDALGAEVGGVPTEAGDYYAQATVVKTDDYNGAEAKLKFTIKKADPAADDITAAKAEVLTYDNTDQVLIQAATSSIGTFKYFVGENAPAADSKDWSDKIATITGKDAATYKVWTLFVPDDNHNAPTVNPTDIDVTIQKAVIQYRLANAEKDWDGQPFADDEITAAYTPEIGGLLGDDITADPAPFTLSVPDKSMTDAGTYTFTKLTVTPAEPTNYDVRFSGTAQLTINKADIVADDFNAPEALNPEFNGKAQDLVSEGEMKKDHEFGTFYYAQAKEVPAWNDNDATHAGWTLAVPQATNANHYPVWYAIAGDNNHNGYVVAEAIDATITAAKLAVTMLPAKYQKPVESKYTAYDQTPSDITLTGLTENQDYKIQNPYAETGIVDVDTYTLTVVGLNNYAGSTLPVTIKITKAPLMVTAPSAEKTYDATNVVEATEFGKPVFNGLLGEDKPFDLGDANAYVTVPADAINFGEYELTMAIGDVPAQKNYEVKAVLPGTLTINKVKNAKIGITKKYTKVYGEADPEKFTFAASDLTQEGIADDLTAIVGQLKATRTETGEEVTEEGKGYKVQLALTDKAKFQENYENIEYGSTIMSITPAKLTISIASASKPYDGKPAELKWADNLENMVVAGLPKDKDGNEYPKAEIFSTLPTIAIVAKEDNTTNANTYNILLNEDYESKNYDVTLIQGSYFTIDPVVVEGQFNNTYTTEVGAVVADVLASVDWTVVAADEDQIGAEETVAAALKAEPALFELTYVGAQDKDKKIAAGETGENALLIVYKGTESIKNFKFVAGSDKGNLNVGAAGSVLALDDSEEIVTTAGKATVTFSQSRNVKQDVWQAAVLPFKTTPAEISDAFGYAAVDVLDKSRTNDKEVHFCLMVTGDIEAGTPFLFKTDNNNNFNNVTFENVQVVATENLNTTVEDDDAESPSGIKFIGTFKETPIWGVNYRYLSSGTWYNAKNFTESNPATIKPLRAYLDMNGNASARIFIEEPDGTTSIMSIREFNEGMTAEGWYTIEGKKLNAAPTQKGVYIQNGKKVVIK